MRMLMEAFDKVFTPEGNVRICGRDACSELIELANTHFPHKNSFGQVDKEYYGYVKTGTMRILPLLELRSHLKQSLGTNF